MMAPMGIAYRGRHDAPVFPPLGGGGDGLGVVCAIGAGRGEP